ncbi:hypothetical protein HPP92_000305 [Vanilla planifolia]|uniref:galactinol--sucrose galactosyltransferase n=1 Tax=Vanilla planifolia TaxID=51239 RepID=A0A835RU73_VANPL|nr:hypothetical protein HPP92_000305 [Vanilla planifolia]
MAPNFREMTTDSLFPASASPTSFSFKPNSDGRRDLALVDHPFLFDVPNNILLTASLTFTSASFLGFHSATTSSRHVIPLGRLSDTPFLSIFRFKIWWTTHWVGSSGRHVQNETQLLLLDRSAEGRPYVVLFPIVDGPFRASLQPGAAAADNEFIDLCLESGSSSVSTDSALYSLYLHAGDDPFSLLRDAVASLRHHLGTFRLLEEKTLPPIVDRFGWCTWDAFYLAVRPAGVREGVSRLVSGGCPPGFVLIDDGWQTILRDDEPLGDTGGMNHTVAGEQMPCRLVSFEENDKFRSYRSGRDGAKGMDAFVRDLKEEFISVESVYVWHALCGYWGGVRPAILGMPESTMVKPMLSPGAEMTMEDLAVDKIVNNGVGLVPPEKAAELFDGLHSRLAAAGIDGVKVDVIHILEMLCEEYGGRVDLNKAYFNALTKSVRKHFNGNGVIASMEHCNDFFILGTETISLGRVGDDFWCTDPSGDPNGTYWLQGCHMVHCAYNSLWMGHFIHPDWDMFQSTHPCAAFHAASRAISGGPVYVSDSVGCHDFALLRSLVLPDGSILRCDHHALPTKDCLFLDPLHDGKSMLKIWNLNKVAGVLGLFNCQGGGWCPEARRNKCASDCSRPVVAMARPNDIEWSQGNTRVPVDGIEFFAVYFHQAKKVALLKPDDEVEITLEPFCYELLTVSPVMVFSKRGLRFAPIGLTNMLNTGGAVQTCEVAVGPGECSSVKVEVKAAGEMTAFSSERPTACKIDGEEAEFAYEDGLVTIEVPWSGSSSETVADPKILADYVVALLKNEMPTGELLKLCADRLEVFLGSSSMSFTAKLFQGLQDGSISSTDANLGVIKELEPAHCNTSVDASDQKSLQQKEANDSTSSEPDSDPGDKENTDDDDDRNHKHRKRDARPTSSDNGIQELPAMTHSRKKEAKAMLLGSSM